MGVCICRGYSPNLSRYSSFKKIIYFNWRLITFHYCSGFCHTLTWVSHGCIALQCCDSFCDIMKWISFVVVQRLSCVWLCATPWTVACQALLSMGFSRQEYWSGLLFPSPKNLPNPGIKLASPALAGGSFTAEPQGKEAQWIAICIHMSPPCWASLPPVPQPNPLGHHRAASWGACALCRFLLAICFAHVVYTCQSSSPSLFNPLLPPLGPHVNELSPHRSQDGQHWKIYKQ